MIEIAPVVFVFAALPKHEVQIVLEIVQHQTLSVLDSVCVEDKAFDCIESFLVENFILVLIAVNLFDCLLGVRARTRAAHWAL